MKKFLLTFALILLSLTASADLKYVFLFIGDGMSYPQFQAAADYLGKQCRAESFTVGEVTVRQSGGRSTAVMAETLRQTAERLMRPYAASGEFCFRGVRG